jgi:hypothetical protein
MKLETYKIPATLMLLGTQWKVITQKSVRSSKNEDCWGTVDYEKRLITLTPGPGDKAMETFLHECGHIFNHLTSMGTEKESSETFAKISSLFYSQLFRQLEHISSKPIKRKHGK